jgi:hypothetical protein
MKKHNLNVFGSLMKFKGEHLYIVNTTETESIGGICYIFNLNSLSLDAKIAIPKDAKMKIVDFYIDN